MVLFLFLLAIPGGHFITFLHFYWLEMRLRGDFKVFYPVEMNCRKNFIKFYVLYYVFSSGSAM